MKLRRWKGWIWMTGADVEHGEAEFASYNGEVPFVWPRRVDAEAGQPRGGHAVRVEIRETVKAGKRGAP